MLHSQVGARNECVFVPTASLHTRQNRSFSCSGSKCRARRVRACPTAFPILRTSRVVPMAVLDAEKTTEESSEVVSESRLRQDHLNAYFDADESMYQTSLSGVTRLALQNFAIELGELLTGFRRIVGLEGPVRFTPPECLNFKLSNEAVTNREREREFDVGELPASWPTRQVYKVTCAVLDFVFEGRPIPRFWFLETVARMPYFSYTSCLHLLSTLGWFRSPTLMNMHHAEELNEAYHLAVMESLGGDKRWRVCSRISRIALSCTVFRPTHSDMRNKTDSWRIMPVFYTTAESYRFSQLLESHAVDTYAEFVDSNRELLRSLPAPEVANEYYANFRYYFYEFQLSAGQKNEEELRRPQIESLLDVFENVLLDEVEHTKTMSACIDYIVDGEKMWYNGKAVSASSRRPNAIPSQKRKEFWAKWSKLHNGRD